jgi:4-carboxymuconolactone decarboxylase
VESDDPVESYETILRRLAIGDDGFVDSALSDDEANLLESALDPKTHALVRLGALVSVQAAPASYVWTIEAALEAGATRREIVGTLVAVMPAIGSAPVVAAAPKVGLALGYDVAAALERRAASS